MTGDLLQSDIDLARRLIDAGESDAEIIVALGYRNIGPEKAQRLVRDLRSGLDVEPDPTPDASGRKGISSVAAVPGQGAAGGRLPAPRPRQNGGEVPWFRIVLLGVVGVSLAGIFLFNRHSRTAVSAISSEAAANPRTNQGRQTLSVEVESGNVRIGEIALSRKNALKTLSEVAGAPTRTNRVDELTIYAFDKQGILLYADKQAGKDWLLLYFEPVGGTNGAQNPFLGTLMIRSNPVTTTTASKSLAAIPQLELSETATNVFSAKCDGLGLSFAYLKTPDRLSLVQIDLE